MARQNSLGADPRKIDPVDPSEDPGQIRCRVGFPSTKKIVNFRLNNSGYQGGT